MRPVGRRALDRIPPAPCTPGEHSPSPSASSRHRTGEGSSCIIHRSSFIVSPPQHPPGNYQPATEQLLQIQHSAFSIQHSEKPPFLPVFSASVSASSASPRLRLCCRNRKSRPTRNESHPRHPSRHHPAPGRDRRLHAQPARTKNQSSPRPGRRQRHPRPRYYGGLVTGGEEINRFLKRQDDLHTIAFVKDKAICRRDDRDGLR